MSVKYNNKHRIICNRLLRSTNVCALCLKPFLKRKDVTIDHVIPLSKGGPDVPTNMQLAHPWCNHQKGDGVFLSVNENV